MFCLHRFTDTLSQTKLLFTVLPIFKFRYTELVQEAEHHIQFFPVGKWCMFQFLKKVFIDLIEI